MTSVSRYAILVLGSDGSFGAGKENTVIMGTRMMGAHGEGSGTRRLFKAYTLVGAAVLPASLAWLSFLVTSADDGSVSGIVITVHVPGGDIDLEGLLFGGNPNVNTDWTDGNVCAGMRPGPGAAAPA